MVMEKAELEKEFAEIFAGWAEENYPGNAAAVKLLAWQWFLLGRRDGLARFNQRIDELSETLDKELLI